MSPSCDKKLVVITKHLWQLVYAGSCHNISLVPIIILLYNVSQDTLCYIYTPYSLQYRTYLPTYLPTHPPTHQETNQPTNQPTKPTDKQINWTTDQINSQPNKQVLRPDQGMST